MAQPVVLPDYAASLEFLRWFRPEGPWCLAAINPDRKEAPEVKSFVALEPVEAWLSVWGKSRNIYFTVNPLRHLLDRKPARVDVEALAWLHVDLDPRPIPNDGLERNERGRAEHLHAEQKRINALLTTARPAGVPQPSAVIFSGGGFQGFWRLREPMPIKGMADLCEEAARYNRQLQALLGGDNTHNVDRIMRLPGTVNRPDDRKRAKGQREALARVAYRGDEVYDLGQFVPAPPLQAPDLAQPAAALEVPGNLRRLASVDELPVQNLCKMAIVQGCDPDDPSRWPGAPSKGSRSEVLFFVCCELVRAGITDEVILSVITDPDFKISESVLEQRQNSARYALRQIQRARDEVVNPLLRRLNEEYAVVLVDGRARILRERPDLPVTYIAFPDFLFYMNDQQVETGQDAKGRPVTMPLGKWWTQHPQHRKYSDVVFEPAREVPGAYNLWKGFAVEARPGDCSLYLDHVRDVICSGNEEHYRYVLGWMASAVQHPDRLGQTAIVLRGRQGTGKNIFADVFGELFGRHYLSVRDSEHLFGRFNGHLRECVVLFGNEAFWAGSKRNESLIKSLITESQIMIENKYRDSAMGRNCTHIIFASNEDWVVPAGFDDRRFFVLDVSDSRQRDNDFFARLRAQMAAGGSEALLHFLLAYDVKDFDIRTIPGTRALAEQKLMTMSPELEWWSDKLVRGRIFEHHDGWQQDVFVTELVHDLIACAGPGFMKSQKSGTTRLGLFLKRVCPKGWPGHRRLPNREDVVQVDGTVRSVVRPYIFSLPTLEAAREHWRNVLGGPALWEDSAIEEPANPAPVSNPFEGRKRKEVTA